MLPGKHTRSISILRCVFGQRIENAIVRFRKSRAKQWLRFVEKRMARVAAQGAMIAGAGLLMMNTTFAEQPTGADVVAGSAVISVGANVMDVNAASARTIINWDQFSIGAGNTANFNLPDANSAILNRVTSVAMPSVINGALNSNGHVHLVNPSGIMVGATGVINTNAFVASTFDIANSDFLKGGALTFSNSGSNASIVNNGTINTGAGGAHLIANNIANNGTITSVGGNITMSGGGEVTLSNGVNYVQPTLETLASGISPTAGLIQNAGTIRATGAATSGGEVYLVSPNGKILHDGTIAASKVAGAVPVPSATSGSGDADGSRSEPATLGGHVQLEADEITLTANSSIDASGTNGGGEVLVGGDWQGGGSMAQATTVTMEAGAVIDASATEQGDGGKIVLWSDVHNLNSVTKAFGTLIARAGQRSGNGGQIETSGHDVDTSGISVNAGAANGEGGHWLIDPYDYWINAVTAMNIVATLNSGTSVTVTTTSNNVPFGSQGVNTAHGDITVTSDIVTGAMSGDATLTLQAARHIDIGANIDATQNGNTAKLNVTLLADTDGSGDGINIVSANEIKTNGGNLQFGDGSTATIGGQSVKVGGDVYINSNAAQLIDTGGGDITINGETIVANTDGVSVNSGGGNIVFGGLLNSGNQYTYVDGPDGQANSWDWARNDAKNGTAGGSTLGDSYMVTITSRLENAIAGIAAGYRGAWIGAYRDTATPRDWVWADGPESGQHFFTELDAGGGSAESGWYSNFGDGEPNGGPSTTGETRGQFFGNAGQWNDLGPGTTFLATQETAYSVLGYVRETNLNPTAVTIDAGSGTVTMGGVGGGKALSTLNVTSAATTLNGNSLVTSGTQVFSSGLTVNAPSYFTFQSTGMTAGGIIDVTASGNLTLNSNLTTTGDSTAINLRAGSTIDSNLANPSIVAQAGNVLLRADAITVNGTLGVTSTGTLTVEPASNSFSSGFNNNELNLLSTLGGLTIGKTGNTTAIVLSNDVTTVDSQNYIGPVTLSGNRSLTTTNSNITLDGTVNSDGTARSLIVSPGTANATFNGAVGGSAALSALTVNGTANVNADVTTSGAQNWTDTFTIGGSGTRTLNAGTLTTQAIVGGNHDLALVTDDLNLGGNVASTGAITIAPKTAGTNIGVGNISGTFSFDNTDFSRLQDGFSSVTIGNSASGDLTVGGITAFTDDLILRAGTTSDLFVNDSLAWSSDNTLTLAAGQDIFVNSNIDITGSAAGLNLLYGSTDGISAPTSNTNYYLDVAHRRTITFDDIAASLKIGNEAFTLVDSVSALQAMAAGGRYALAGDLSLAGTTYTDAFYTSNFAGKLDGLGNEVDGLTIRASAGGNFGLFGQLGGATVRHLGVTKIDLLGQSTSNAAANDLRIGGIVGNATGSGTTVLDGVWSTGVIATKQGSQQDVFYAGGIVGGHDSGTLQILRTFSTVNVSSQGSHSGKMALGGLLGDTGDYNGISGIGGSAQNLLIDRSYATGSIVEGTYAGYYGSGGLVGVIYGDAATLTDSFSRSNVVGGISSGGIAGYSLPGTVKTYQRLYTTLDRFGNGTSPTQSYKSDTLAAATVNGTQLPSGWSSDVWTVGEFPTLKAVGVPASLLYVKVISGTGVYGNLAAPTYQIVDAGGNVVTLGNGDYANLDGVTGTGRYTLGQFTNTGTYNSVSYLSGLSFTGDDANLYALNPFTTAGSYTITPRSITAVLANTGVNKVYDGNVNAGSGYTPSWSFTNIVSGDSATVNTGSLFFNDADVLGANLFTINGLSLAGITGSNGSLMTDYSLSNTTASVAASITAKPIVINGLFANDKIYDGTATGSINSSSVTYSGLVTGDSVTLGSLGGTFADKNVGTDKTVSVTGAFTGTDASNYSTSLPTTLVADITVKTITLDGFVAADKVYDATLNASITNSGSLTGVVTGDTVSVSNTGATFADKNVGSGKTVTLNGVILAGSDATNYSVASTATDSAEITAKAITVGGLTGVDRVYDGTTVATVDLSGVTFSGIVSGDDLSASGTSGVFADKNVGASKALTLSGTTYGGTDVGNYSFTDQASTSADITAKSITVSGLVANALVYDGTTTATVDHSGVTFNGLVSGDVLSATGTTGAFDNKNVGTGKAVTLADTTYGGTDVGNYSFTNQTSTTGDITTKSITVSGLTADSRVYDGGTTATVDHSGVTFNGMVSGDVLSAASTTGAFDNKNVGTSKAVTLSGTTYGGTDVGNYSFTNQTSTTADVTAKSITVSGLTADSRVYDGATTATVDHSGVTFNGIVSGDILSAASTSGTFDNKNAGTGKAVTLSGTTYGGTDVGNYSFTNQASATGDITVRSITVSGITADSRVYDGGTTATVDHSGVTFSGIVSGDNLSATATTGVFDNKNVGSGKAVTLSGTTYGGTDVGNYAFTDQASTTADVTARSVTVSGLTGIDRAYDGTTSVTVDHSGVTFSGIVSGDVLTASGTAGVMADKNVGAEKSVTLSGTTFGGTDVGNYSFTNQAATTADISKRLITINGIAGTDKVYDGSLTADLDLSGTSAIGGVISGDDFSVRYSSSFGDKNVGTSKTVNIASTLLGDDAGNYSLSHAASVTADIIQKAIIVGGITADSRVYDGTTTANVDQSGVTFGGIVSGDNLTATATTGVFDNKHVGTGKTVILSGTTYGGTDVGNYSFADQATATADVTQRQITVSGLAGRDKVYNGRTNAQLDITGASFVGTILGDDIIVGLGSLFSGENVGTNKTVNVSGELNGADAGNYSLSHQATVTADITPASIIISGIAANGKVYDGNTTATVDLSGVTFNGIILGDDLTATATLGTFDNKDVGTGKAVTLSGTNYGGSDVGNYTFTDQTSTIGGVTAKSIIVNGLSANDRIYDGTTTTTIDHSGVAFNGIIVGDDLTVANTVGAFADKNVGSGKTVTLSGTTYGGTDVGNYSFTDQTVSTADISAKGIVVNGITAANRVYDGTTTATIELNGIAFAGIVAGDDLAASGTTGMFADKNVDTGKTVTLAGTTYGGTDVGNYSFTNQTSTTANVTAKSVIISGLTAGNRVYDGTTVATIDHSGVTFNGIVGGDSLTASNTTGTFADKNVGTGKAVTLAGTTFGGTDVGNYSFTDQATSTADISQKSITVSGIAAAGKVYDGSTLAPIDLSTITFNGMVSGDSLTASGTAGVFADKNVGSSKTVTLSGTSYSGTDVANYTIADQITALADISRLGSVTWIGGTSGDWSDPANWAGGAIPDLANVAAVIIPDGVTPIFDSSVTGPVDIDSLTGGNFQIDSGTLSVANDATLDDYTQNGGTFNVGGNFSFNTATINDGILDVLADVSHGTFIQNGGTVEIGGNLGVTDFEQHAGTLDIGGSLDVSSSFYQSPLGAIDVIGNVDITHTAGELTVGNLSGHNVNLNSTNGGVHLGNINTGGTFDVTAGNGDIDQLSGTSITATGTSTFDATGDIMLTNPGNDFVGPVNATGANVAITDDHGGLILGDIMTSGTFDATSTDGPIAQSLTGTLTINGPATFTATEGGNPADIILSNLDNDFAGPVSADGRNIELFDARGGLALHNIVASGDFVAASNNGSITQTNDGGINVTGTTTVAATSGGAPADIILTNKSNNLAGTVNAAGKTVNIDDADSRLQFGKVSAGDKDDLLMETAKVIVRDTNTRYTTEETSSNNGILNVVQRYGQQWMTRLVQWLANPASPKPILSEQNVQSVQGEIKIVSGGESKFSKNAGDTSVQ